MATKNGTGFWRLVGRAIRAPLEERALRAEAMGMERLHMEASRQTMEQIVRAVQPEDDGFVPILAAGQRELDETTQQSLRARARTDYQLKPHMRGYIRTLERFVVGKGVTITPELDDDATVKACADWWKKFRRANNWDRREDELPRRGWRDGEVFVRRAIFDGQFTPSDEAVQALQSQSMSPASLRPLVDIPRGMLLVRFIDPEHVRDPEGRVSHGIVTDKDDVETVLGYMFAPSTKLENVIPAADVIHWKVGVDSDVKRGRSVLEPLMERSKKYEDWLNYRLALNLARAAVVWIKTVEGTRDQGVGIRDARETQRQTSPETRRTQMVKPLTTIHTSPGITYDFKSPNLQAQDAQHDGRAILLTMAAATGLPEYIFTGDSSNSNFASHLVSESPALREFEYWQDDLTPVLVQIYRWAMIAGAQADQIKGLDAETAESMDIAVEWPPLLSRDELQHTQANEIRYKNGALSREGWAHGDGIDWETESKRLQAELENRIPLGIDRILELTSKLLLAGGISLDSSIDRYLRNLLSAPMPEPVEPGNEPPVPPEPVPFAAAGAE